MEISVYIDGRKPRKTGEMPVKIALRRSNKTVFVNTGLFTHTKFIGTVFPASETAAKAKTARLTKILADINELSYRYPTLPLTGLKDKIDTDILGHETTTHSLTIADLCDKYATGMKATTARLYTLTADRIREYDSNAIPSRIDTAWLRGFEAYLRDTRRLSVNGIAQKMRNIRHIMNNCRDEGLIEHYPFGRNGYTIREEETAVDNLTAQEFAVLRDYPCEPWQQIYRDIFCLSTYLAGINIGDLLLCRGLTNGRLVFVRRKTDKSNATKIRQISLPVYPEAMEIINRYKGKDYLLNIMDNMSDYTTFTQHYNKALKKIGPITKVADKQGKLRKVEYHPLYPFLTTNSARYTFASVAVNELDISDRAAGMCMGHSWTRNVTARYISNDQAKIDDTIRRVIDRLNEF